MVKNFDFKIEGLDKLLKDIKELPKEIQEEVLDEIREVGHQIGQKAKQRAPKDMSRLAMSTGAIDTPDGVEVFSSTNYAAFVEFGTGTFATKHLSTMPAEVGKYAMQFYVNGKGRMPARPFFFNSFFEEKPKLIARIKEVLKLK